MAKSITELMDLGGQVAIVTGGAVGIGEGICGRLAEAGATVVVADLDEDGARRTAKELSAQGGRAIALHVDVADAASVDAMVLAAVDELGHIDILVNNAGIYPAHLVLQLDVAEFDRVVATNLRGVFLATRAVALQMVAQGHGGRIVNVTSIDALHPSSAGLAHYDASKHGVWGFTKNAALELAEHGITVNAVAPGGILTPGAMRSSADATSDVDTSAMMAQFLKRIPMHRLGEPDEIGTVVLFLVSGLASYMTGSQVVVDGGVLLS